MWRFEDRGEAKRDCVGEDICIARTADGVRNGGLASTLLGVRSLPTSGRAYEDPLGTREIVSFSFPDAASSPTCGEVSNL